MPLSGNGFSWLKAGNQLSIVAKEYIIFNQHSLLKSLRVLFRLLSTLVSELAL